MASRKSYSREFKLQVVNYYHNFNLYQTIKKFDIHNKSIRRWVKQEKALLLSSNTSKRMGGFRTGLWPELEEKLMKEIKELRRNDESRVKKDWVICRANELKEEMDPAHPLAFSGGWYDKFKRRNGLSKRGTSKRRGRPRVCKAEQSGCDVTEEKTAFDESQVEMDPQETSQEQQGDWMRVEIKVEQDDQDEDGTSQDVSNDLRDLAGSVDQDRSSTSFGSQSDIPDTQSDQWTAWIKEEIDTDDETEVGNCWPGNGAKGSWQGGDDDTSISTQNVKNIRDWQSVNTWLQTSDVGNKDDECHPSIAREVLGSEESKQKEHNDASLEPTKGNQKEGSQEPNIKREAEDSKREVTTSQGHHVCGSCYKAFKIKRNLEAHERTHRGKKPFACDMCSEAFDEKAKFNTHMRQHDKYACVFCPETFADKGELRKHVMSHPGVRHHACLLCREGFITKRALYAHMQTHERPFVCELCREAFLTKRDLQLHMETHERTFSCNLCPKAFHWKSDLQTHKRRAHSKKFACESCDKKFRTQKKLEKHFIREHVVKREPHVVTRPYTCTLCPNSFSQEYYLEIHMDTHTGIICDVCSQSFSSESELETHIMREHPEHTRYACDMCCCAFRRKINRDRHRRWKHP